MWPDLEFWLEPRVLTAVIAASAGITAAVVGLAPHLGRLRRLERAVAIIEKLEDGESRRTMVVYRDRLVRKFRPRVLVTVVLGIAAFAALLGSVVVMGLSSQLPPGLDPLGTRAQAAYLAIGLWIAFFGFGGTCIGRISRYH